MDKMLRLWGMFQQKIKASDVNINLFSKKKKKKFIKNFTQFKT